MIHYYEEKLPDEVLERLVADTDDAMIVPQDWLPEDKEQQKVMLDLLCQTGRILVFDTGKITIVITRRTAWVGNFDTKVAKEATARDVVKGYKSFVEWAKTTTGYYKLETRTPLKKFAITMAKAGGGKLEGVREKSYRTKDGKMVDEYLVGVVLKEDESCQ